MFCKQRNRSSLLSVLIALMLLLTNASAVAASAKSEQSACDQAIHFEHDEFTHPTKINNKWMSLVPGTQFIFDGFINQAGLPVAVPHQVVLTVTDLTKVINGVQTVVLWDRDFDDGQLVEAELAFFAQDNAGNVWNLGEYPEVYENGEFVGAPDTWIAGLRRAQAGIHMLAKPRVGTDEYLQGWAPNIDFLDCATVFKKGQTLCVPVTCYENVLVTDETSPLDPESGHQRKYHAPGVGIIQVGAVGDPEAETLALVKRVRLSAHNLAEARESALRLDRRAYRVSNVYRHTSPAE